MWILHIMGSLIRSVGFIKYKFWNKVTQGVTHSDTPVSSVSSWSLGAWAALEKHWAGDAGWVQQQGADSKSPKILSPTKSSAGLSEVTKHSYSRHKTCFSSRHLSPDTSPQARISPHGVILNFSLQGKRKYRSCAVFPQYIQVQTLQ